MFKPTFFKAVGLLLVGFLVGVAVFAAFQKNPLQSQSYTHTLVQRLQGLQRLEVLQAHLLSHRSYQARSWLGLNHDSFLITARARALYGLDVQKAQLIQNAEGTTTLSLPPVQVLELILNPDQIEYIGVHKGWLTAQPEFQSRQQEALRELQADLQQQARRPELLKSAREQAQAWVESWLRQNGLEKVKVVFQEPGLEVMKQ